LVAAATRTLPRDISGFTGRGAELARLTAGLADTAATGGVVGIHAIGGMAGIGKATLAVHAAHRLAGRFPDGQIFLPLHAHTPGQRPVDPADALASLLRAAGLGADAIPAGLHARAGCWRDCLAGKKVLLVLDDAAGHEQVRPLLPGTAGSLVLITSRRRLTALEDATAISLDTLPPDEATQLLARLAGRPDIGPGDGAVAELTRLCGYLPLAIGMLARQLYRHPAWAPAGLAAGQRRLFRRLGLHPGPDIDAHAAAALAGTSLATARRHLAALYDQHLIGEPAPAVTGCTTCFASTPRRWPPPTTRLPGRPPLTSSWTIPAHRAGPGPARLPAQLESRRHRIASRPPDCAPAVRNHTFRRRRGHLAGVAGAAP
jgi:NB-ARC domain